MTRLRGKVTFAAKDSARDQRANGYRPGAHTKEAGHRHHILHRLWRKDPPIPISLLGRHDLTIVADDLKA